jgi:hypothetical protein
LNASLHGLSSSSPDTSSFGLTQSTASTPVAGVHCPHTWSRSGIFKPREHTNGTIAWIVVCMAQVQVDPTFEPRHYQASMSMPHWHAGMELEV